jgi:hypothetical protein
MIFMFDWGQNHIWPTATTATNIWELALVARSTRVGNPWKSTCASTTTSTCTRAACMDSALLLDHYSTTTYKQQDELGTEVQ